jgi:hypothetical protein
MHGIAGMTIDEIIRTARREAWGPFPGDPDHEEVVYTLKEASALTGISHSALCARAQRGSLPTRREEGLYVISEFDLAWFGLIGPAGRRSLAARPDRPNRAD